MKTNIMNIMDKIAFYFDIRVLFKLRWYRSSNI